MRTGTGWALSFCALITLFGAVSCTKNHTNSPFDLSYPIEQEPKSLDLGLATDYDSQLVLTQLHVGLTKQNAVGALVPGLAQRWEVDSSGRVFRFHLRSAKWSDGEEIRAGDFVSGWKHALDPKLKSIWGQRMSCIKGALAYWLGETDWSGVGIQSAGDKLLEVHIDRSDCDLLRLVSMPGLYPQRSDSVGRYHSTHEDLSTMPVSGPFVLESWQPDTRLILRANKQFYGSMPQLRRIELLIQSSPSAGYGLYERGELDVVYPVPTEDLARAGRSGDLMWFVVGDFNIASPLVLSTSVDKVSLLTRSEFRPFPLAVSGYPMFAEIKSQTTTSLRH